MKHLGKYLVKIVCTVVISIFITTYSFAQQKMTMEQLKVELTYKKYPAPVLDKLLNEVNKLSERPNFHESIPGEIIEWDFFTRGFSFTQSYLVKGTKLIPIKIIPDDTTFLAQLNSLAPEGIRYTYSRDQWSFGLVKEHRKDDSYLILCHSDSYSPHPDIPSDDIMGVELRYTTKDFKHFRLIHCKFENGKEWDETVK